MEEIANAASVCSVWHVTAGFHQERPYHRDAIYTFRNSSIVESAVGRERERERGITVEELDDWKSRTCRRPYRSMEFVGEWPDDFSLRTRRDDSMCPSWKLK